MAKIEEVVSVEELHARQTLRKKYGPTESSLHELNQSTDEWFHSIMTAESTQRRSIPRVPQMLHDTKDFEKHYEPRVVSLGPYHFGNSNLQMVQKLKPKIAKKFVSNDCNVLHNVYNKVLNISKEKKLMWYEENSIDKYLTDEAFARMMVLDGCFVLYYIECVLNEDEKKGKKPDIDDLDMKGHDVAFVQQDLFLLENQLPFFVLNVLMDVRGDFWKNRMSLIDGFVRNNIMGYSGKLREKSFFNLSRLKLAFSLVEEYFTKLFGKSTAPPLEPANQTIPPLEQANQTAPPLLPAHLLHHLHITLVGTEEKKDTSKTESGSESAPDKKHESQSTNNSYTFRNVDELLGVGIQFKRSRNNRLDAIKYVPGLVYGCLELPLITVDDSTRSMFLNLIAYEMCSDTVNEPKVTSYVCFLDSLIDHSHDVKVLRSAGVIHNCLGSDEEVSHLFNDIAYDLVPHPTAYCEVKQQIQKHYDERVKLWMAQFNHEHFRSPWSFFALLGALLVIFLTGAQTYFSVWSSPSECDGLCKYIRETRLLAEPPLRQAQQIQQTQLAGKLAYVSWHPE
ncbi:hypothetical protein LguiB_004234 [Lonicera macranthoides]